MKTIYNRLKKEFSNLDPLTLRDLIRRADYLGDIVVDTSELKYFKDITLDIILAASDVLIEKRKRG